MVEAPNPPTPAPDGPTATRALAAGLAGGRIAIGAGLMLAPRLTLQTLGFAAPTEATVAVARLAGVRDLVLGVAQAAAVGEPRRLRRATIACAAADAGDAAVFGSALGADESDLRRVGARGLPAAAAATVAGAWLASRLA